jgi:hypothetical protein
MSSSIIDIPRDRVVVGVHTTSGRGFTPEEIAARASRQIMHVAETAPAPIRDQAMAFQAQIERAMVEYMKQAIASHNTTVYNVLKEGGYHDAAELIRKL